MKKTPLEPFCAVSVHFCRSSKNLTLCFRMGLPPHYGMDAMKNRRAALLLSYGIRFLVGAAFSLTAVRIATAWCTVCGVSTESLVALFIVTAAACRLCPRAATLRNPFHPAVWMSGVALVACSCVMPSALNVMLTWSVATLDSAPWFYFGFPAVFVAFCVWCLLYWVQNAMVPDDGSKRAAQVAGTTGAVIGFLSPLVHGLTLYPMSAPVAATVSLAMVFRYFIAQEESAGAEHSETPRVPWIPWAQIVGIAGLAVFLHSGTRYLSALMPVTFVLLLPAISLSVIFAALTSAPWMTQWLRRQRVAVFGLLLPVTIPLAFRVLVDINLVLNATVDSVVLLFAARSLQLAVVWCSGILVWKTASSLTGDPALKVPAVMSVGLPGLAAGTCLSAFGVAPPVGMACGLLLTAMPLLQRLQTGSQAESSAAGPATSGRFRFATVAAAAFLVAVLPFDAASTTQLLFSARASRGYRSGLKPDVIAQSTAFRLMQESHSKEGHLTVWRTSGDQIQLCRNGIPVGQISANTLTTPQPITETLPVILPLVMHENASSILLLGDDTGAGLRICSSFPVHTVVASRPDPAATEFAGRYAWDSMTKSPLQDERFRLWNEPVAVTIRRPVPAGNRYDVVVAVSPNPVSMDGLEQLTPEFYEAVRNQLTDRGVFCQRITRHDLGATPLFRIISSVSAVFGRVVMLHMAPGEIAVVAGVSPDSLLDKKLLTRLQRDHVRRALSPSGWDWSQVAALPAIDTSDPVGIFEHQQQPAAASSENGHFAFALPLQAAAWTDKTGELRAAFAPHQQRMADAAKRGAGYDEFARRFSAVVQQSEILTTFPDQPWPYRRSLRTEMQRNPRPPIEVVRDGKVERLPDPRDKRRKEYFVTLGRVLQQAKTGIVDPLALRELASFTVLHEPLLSYFAHHELVRIHEAAAHPSPALELRHRLHTVYFTEGGDLSVQQVTDAIQQILDDPELVADASIRFDYVNSMLQELVRRWDMRRNYNPPSARQTQQVVDACVAVAKEALDALQEWSPTVGMDHTQMLARRKFINKALITPLRTYHEQVLAHRLKNEPAPMTLPEEGPGELPMLINPEDALTN